MSPEQLFGGDESVVIAPLGESMRPLLLAGRDTVVLGRLHGRLKRGDVALYERPNGVLVLHRVMETEPKGYAFLGDAQPMAELETGVGEAQLIGVMTGFFRGDRYIDIDRPLYRLYRRLCLGGDASRRVLRGIWKAYLAGKRTLRLLKKH